MALCGRRARTGSRRSACLTVLADMSTLISVPLFVGVHREAGILRSEQVVLSCPSSLLRPPPTRLPLGCRPLPGVTGYRQARSRPPQGQGRGGPLQFPRHPSDRSTSPTPEGPSPPAPPRFDPGLSTGPGGFATGDPGVSPDRTSTGWLSRACARLRHDRSVALRRPAELLDARASGLDHHPSPEVTQVRACAVSYPYEQSTLYSADHSPQRMDGPHMRGATPTRQSSWSSPLASWREARSIFPMQ